MLTAEVSGLFVKKINIFNSNDEETGKATKDFLSNALRFFPTGSSETGGFRVVKPWFFGDVNVLTTGSKLLFTVKKSSMLNYHWKLSYKGMDLEIKSTMMGLRRYEILISGEDEPVGFIEADSAFATNWSVEFPDSFPEWYQGLLFCICYSMHNYRSQG